MPKFNYKAKDINGSEHQGVIETSDTHQVARVLSKKGLILISTKEINEKGNQFFDKFFNRVSFSDLVIMTRQLSTMIESGLVLSDALDILVEQQDNKKFKEVLSQVSRDVKNGLDLAGAVKKHPDVFPPLYSSLIRAGEQAGKLDVVLTQMATNLEKDREFRSKIRGAMIYPIIVFSIMIVVLSIMMIFVIPRLVSFYSQSGIELPITTKILITISNFFVNFWWLMIAAGVGLFLFIKRWTATPDGKYKFDIFLLKIPVVGKVVKGSSLTNFNRTFGLLIHSGLPILDSLLIVADVVGNSVYKKSLEDCYRGVERGLPLSAQLELTGSFPKIISQMYRVGEETGKVDEIAFKLAEYFESETDHLVKNLTVIIEPLVIVILGLGVAFIVISLILPIYKLTTSFT